MQKLFENWRRFLTEKPDEIANKIKEIKFNSASALSVFRDNGTLAEEETKIFDYEISLAENPDDTLVQRFDESLYSGKKTGFLSPYSPNELRMMDLYLLRGHNAGFAIKDGDDIVSVHNNSELSGLAREFMRKAKEVGGVRLDHFDGFLTGLYKKYGFTNVYEIYQWDEQYAPSEWSFEGVSVLNPATSVYAQALDEITFEDPETLPNKTIEVLAESGLKLDINPSLKYNSYKYGRPDVIMRKLA